MLMYIEGDTAVALLKAGAETDKKDTDGLLALQLAPDAQVFAVLLVLVSAFLQANAL